MNRKRRPGGLLFLFIRTICGTFATRVTAFVSVTHYVPIVSDFAAFLLDPSRLLVCLSSVSLSMWARFTPQIRDTIAIGLTTGTLFIVIVILGSLGAITCCQKTACNEHGQQGSQ